MTAWTHQHHDTGAHVRVVGMARHALSGRLFTIYDDGGDNRHQLLETRTFDTWYRALEPADRFQVLGTATVDDGVRWQCACCRGLKSSADMRWTMGNAAGEGLGAWCQVCVTKIDDGLMTKSEVGDDPQQDLFGGRNVDDQPAAAKKPGPGLGSGG